MSLSAKNIVLCFQAAHAVLHVTPNTDVISSSVARSSITTDLAVKLLDGSPTVARCPAVDVNGVVRCTYPEVGRAAFGWIGEWVIRVFVVVEFFGACAMCLVMMWRITHESLLASRGSRALVIAVASVVVLPTVWIRQFSRLAFIRCAQPTDIS